jgi:hypothetical protein
LTVFAWIFFRAENISHAFSYIGEIFSKTIFEKPQFPKMFDALITFSLIVLFLIVEWLGKKDQFALEKIIMKPNKWFRMVLYFILISSLFWFSKSTQEFIYFQF